VHGRDDIDISRLPPAAEPRHTDDICQLDEPESTTTDTTETDPNFSGTSLSNRFEVGLSPFDWIDTDDTNADNDDLLESLRPVQLPILNNNFRDQDCDEKVTPHYALSAIDDQINELGVTKDKFYDQL
jgi:hypothetical protein